MNGIKRFLLLLITILIMVVVCGCMRVEQDYKEPIQNYLKEKYGCDFEVKQVTKEFSGLDGNYLRAICQSKTNNGTFEVYCYPVGEKTGDKITIVGREYIIYDDYGDIVFQNQLEQQLRDQIETDVFLRCQTTFSNHFITDEEYKAGIKSCLDNPELASHVVVYVVMSNQENVATIRDIVEANCLQYNAYRQYLYFATTPSTDLAVIQQHYNQDTESYDQHMNECDLIDKVYFSLIKRDEGITKKSVEKE